MSETVENTTTRHIDPRLRYLAPVIVVLGLILLGLALAASCSSRSSNNQGLKPFRPTRTPVDNDANGAVLLLAFVDLNSAPATYQNQRIRVTGDKATAPPKACRLFTGPAFTWGLIAEDLQLNALGFEELVKKLPDGLTMTVEGVWRRYDGPLGCGKGPDDGVLWYLQVERIIAPNPLPLVDGGAFATIQVPLGTRLPVDGDPFVTQTPETAVTSPPGIGITTLPTATYSPNGTQPPPATPTLLPTSTAGAVLPTTTTTPLPGLTPSATPPPGSTATATIPGAGTATITPTPSATAPGIATQTPAPTVPGYPDPNTPVPTSTSYPGS